MAARHNPVDVLSKDSLATMNLNVLRRIDPDVTQLLATAGHVALYDYDVAKVKWTTKGIEGTLFLIKRRTQPHYQLIVLNKKSQDHFVEDVHGTFKFEGTEREGRSYLLYKSSRGGVVGIWFYDKDECQKVMTLLKDVTTEVSKTAWPPSTSAVSPSHPLLAAMQGKKESGVVAQPSPAPKSDDSFWDKGSTATAPAVALLQPDGQRSGQSPESAATGTAATASPVSKGGPLEKLFGSMRVAASGATPQASPQITGLPPFKNAEAAHSPLRQPSTPGAAPLLTPTAPSTGGGSAPIPPATQLPPLLKPSFFQTPTGAATARDSFDRTPVCLPPMTAASAAPVAGPPASTPTVSGQDNLLKLFASKAQTEKTGTGRQPEQLSPTATHALVRNAMKVLADSDEFIAVVVQELGKSGLLKHLSAS